MVISQQQLEARGIKDLLVLQAIRNLPRELFVSKELRENAYQDTALPIDCGQTISQPYIVAYMTEQLELKPTNKVLEIGTGSGFQTGVLAQLVQEVYTIEKYEKLSEQSQKILTKLGYKNVKYRIGDGKLGWKEAAPFEAIIITAAAQEIPPLLLHQLKVGGRMILPLELELDGQYRQDLFLIKKTSSEKLEYIPLIPVKFVPLL